MAIDSTRTWTTRRGVVTGDPASDIDAAVSSLITLTGSGFGTKSTAAPFFYENFESYSDGKKAVPNRYADLGGTAIPGMSNDLDRSIEYPYFAYGATPYVDSTYARIGTKSLRWDMQSGSPGTQESFPLIGLKDLNTVTLYQCWHTRLVRTAGTGNASIFKAARAAVYEAGGNSWYSSFPKMYSTHTSFNDTGATGGGVEAIKDDGTTSVGFEYPTYLLSFNDWDFCEWEYVLDTASGRFTERINGNLNINLTGVQTTTSALTRIDGTYTMQGCDFSADTALSLYQDTLYVDKSLARVITTDNATYASSAKFLPQSCATWSDTQITFTPHDNEAAYFGSGTVYDHIWASDGTYKSYQSRVI